MLRRRSLPRVLCVGCSVRELTEVHDALKKTGIEILSAATADQGVAACVTHSAILTAVLVHADSIRKKEWPLVRSLKAIRPTLPVILLEQRTEGRGELPEGISAALHINEIGKLAEALKGLAVSTGS